MTLMLRQMKLSTILRLMFTGRRISIVSLLILLCVCSCSKSDSYEKTEEITLTLSVYEGNNPLGNHVKYYVELNEGATKWFPLIHVEGDNDWGLAPGYEYDVLVLMHRKKTGEIVADGSDVEYEFIRVLSTKKTRLLEMNDILWSSIIE